eukprot:7350997-Pyramimonas_sp.AAC.1
MPLRPPCGAAARCARAGFAGQPPPPCTRLRRLASTHVKKPSRVEGWRSAGVEGDNNADARNDKGRRAQESARWERRSSLRALPAPEGAGEGGVAGN